MQLEYSVITKIHQTQNLIKSGMLSISDVNCKAKVDLNRMMVHYSTADRFVLPWQT